MTSVFLDTVGLIAVWERADQMRRLGLTQAFTNDAHFQAAGFETLFRLSVPPNRGHPPLWVLESGRPQRPSPVS
jgi:hypothetical protein